MGVLATLTTTEVIERVLGTGDTGFDDVRRELAAADAAAWAATDPRLLELCRVRIAMLLGCGAEVSARTPGVTIDGAVLDALSRWPTDERFGEVERACLAFTEQFVIDVAALDDETAAGVRLHLGDEGLSSFVHALLVVEQRIRLRLIWDRLLGGQ